MRRLNALLHEYLGPVSRAFLAKLYPEGLFTPGSAAAELVPADYAAAGMGSTYTKVVRDHCQLCHLRVAESDPSPDWTRLVNLRNGGPAYAIYCFPKYLAPIPIVPGDMVMPWAWVPRRNLLQHPMTHELIRQADVYASAPPPGGYRCVAPDLVGFGRSDKPAPQRSQHE